MATVFEAVRYGGHIVVRCSLLIAFVIALASASEVIARPAMNMDPGMADMSGNPGPQTVHIVIRNNQFSGGQPVVVRVGDSVVWDNYDLMPHTATATSQSAQAFDTGFIRPGTSSEPIVFMKESGPAGFPYECDVHDAMIMHGVVIVKGAVGPTTLHESPSIHSMLVLGRHSDDIFLHHYDLFNNPNHSYHVTLEAEIVEPAAKKLYDDWRAANGDGMVAIDPEVFFLPELKNGTRTEFYAKFSETARPGGVETQWGTVIPGLEHAKIKIKRVIEFRHFDPQAKYPDHLTYLLFGNSNEVYLAHEVTEAPNFQQVVMLNGVPPFLTPAIIASAPIVTIPDKQIRRIGPVVMEAAALSNSTHILLAPPVGSLNPTPPLADGEQISITVGTDTTLHAVTVKKSIWYDFRILNR